MPIMYLSLFEISSKSTVIDYECIIAILWYFCIEINCYYIKLAVLRKLKNKKANQKIAWKTKTFWI
jgi:hypothetical protein